MMICVLGLGEAGSAISADLAAAGANVVGYDPADVATPSGVLRSATPDEAVERAEMVLALTAATDAVTALEQGLSSIAPSTVYADLATTSPGLKRRLASIASGAGLRFVDVALMSTVPGKGVRTPMLAAGEGAEAFAAKVEPLGATVEVAGDEPGVAATRKLVRSVAIKGLAAVMIEALTAAERAGLTQVVWTNLVDDLTAADGSFLRQVVAGTGVHAVRRTAEMEAATELLEEIGIEPTMTRATTEALRRVARTGDLPAVGSDDGSG